MSRKIEVLAAGAHARFRIRDDMAPTSAEAFWASLPITSDLHFGIRSGDACYGEILSTPLSSLPERPEFGVVSMYSGWIFVHPVPERGWCEVLFSFGLAEHRWPTGPRPVTPVAEPDGDMNDFFAALKSMRHATDKSITIKRVES